MSELCLGVQLHRNAGRAVMHAWSPAVLAVFLLLYSSQLIFTRKKEVKFYCSVSDTPLSYLYRDCACRPRVSCRNEEVRVEEDQTKGAALAI